MCMQPPLIIRHIHKSLAFNPMSCKKQFTTNFAILNFIFATSTLHSSRLPFRQTQMHSKSSFVWALICNTIPQTFKWTPARTLKRSALEFPYAVFTHYYHYVHLFHLTLTIFFQLYKLLEFSELLILYGLYGCLARKGSTVAQDGREGMGSYYMRSDSSNSSNSL